MIGYTWHNLSDNLIRKKAVKEMKAKTVSYEIVNLLLEYAEVTGISADTLINRANLDEELLKDPFNRFPADQYQKLWQEMVTASADEYFGLHFGSNTSDFCHDNFLHSMAINGPNIKTAMDNFIRYHKLISDIIIPKYHIKGSYVHFTWDVTSFDVEPDRHQNDANLLTLFFFMHGLTKGKINVLAVHFTSTHPSDISEYRRIFNAPLVFNSNMNAIIFRRDYLQNPIFLSNPNISKTHKKTIDSLVTKLSNKKFWSNKVIHAISKSLLNNENPEINLIADKLSINPQDLQIKLREEDNSFMQIFNSVRKEMAIKYIGKPGYSLYDIAYLLGFSEQNLFNQTFKRWTGSNPKNYKRMLENSFITV